MCFYVCLIYRLLLVSPTSWCFRLSAVFFSMVTSDKPHAFVYVMIYSLRLFPVDRKAAAHRSTYKIHWFSYLRYISHKSKWTLTYLFVETTHKHIHYLVKVVTCMSMRDGIDNGFSRLSSLKDRQTNGAATATFLRPARAYSIRLEASRGFNNILSSVNQRESRTL